MNEKPKAKVYIDGANIFYTQKKLGWQVDWSKTKDFLEKQYQIGGWRYYTGVKKGDEKMNSFLKHLDSINFTVITKPLKMIQISNDHPMYQSHKYAYIYKSNFDVEITADLAFDRQNTDLLILFSGDSDFEYIVKRLQAGGKKFIIYSSRKTLSWELKLTSSKYKYLEDNIGVFRRL